MAGERREPRLRVRNPEAPVFLLVAMHLSEVEALSQEDALKKLVPASAKTKCAFYRVWVSCYGKKLEPRPLRHLPTSLSRRSLLVECRINTNTRTYSHP